MNFIEAIKSGFANYANFSGRASRSQFWYWHLFGFLVGFISTLCGALINPVEDPNNLYTFYNLITLLMLLPNLSVTARRLHDVGKSGWWMLISFTVIGIIPLIIWHCTKGTNGINRFGKDPLA